MAGAQWFFIPDREPLPAALNMARDEFLFNLCHEKKFGFFRLYSWNNPSFSFGVSQRISRAVDVDFVTANHCSYVRRMTGGKTVLHNDEITYSVISSEDIFYKDNDLYRSYMLIARVLVVAFKSIGLDAYLSQGSSSSLSRSNNPCFSFPTPNELEINGKKIAGSAQKRDKHALLQHGSIPVSMDYDLYARGTRSDPGSIKNSMTTLSEVSNKTRDDLYRALIESFRSFVGAHMEEFEFDREDNHEVEKIEKKYISTDWNYRF
jgi:lipoyl(octanoyl) transferase